MHADLDRAHSTVRRRDELGTFTEMPRFCSCSPFDRGDGSRADRRNIVGTIHHEMEKAPATVMQMRTKAMSMFHLVSAFLIVAVIVLVLFGLAVWLYESKTKKRPPNKTDQNKQAKAKSKDDY